MWPLRPKMTGRAAFPTSRVAGCGDAGTLRGPLTRAASTAMAMKFSMIVITTSWAPDTAFRMPGMKP